MLGRERLDFQTTAQRCHRHAAKSATRFFDPAWSSMLRLVASVLIIRTAQHKPSLVAVVAGTPGICIDLRERRARLAERSTTSF